MDTSASVAALFGALSLFQGEVSAPTKSSVNPHFKSRYADLAEVLETARGTLAKHGLALVQSAESAEKGAVRITTMLTHKSGEWLRSTLDMPVAQNTPQAVGSAVTYGRRYAAMAMLGLAADDDDGEAATRAPKKQPEQRREAAPQRDESPRGGSDSGSNGSRTRPTTASGNEQRDEYGLVIPQHPCPVVQSEGQWKGKTWAELPGPLLEKMYAEHGGSWSDRQRAWAEHLMARRAARKAREAQDIGDQGGAS